MKIYAVIDTNVLVSAMLSSESIPGYLTERALTGNVVPVLSEEILAEYEEVLSRPKFSFPREAVQALLDGLKKRGVLVEPVAVEEEFADPDDAVFFAVTMETRKSEDAYLVTGNLRHFPLRPFVVTPRQMLDILDKI